jgi:hypothetical protein
VYQCGVQSSWVHSALRPPVGLLCQPRVIMMMEKLVEWWLAGETEVLWENLAQCYFVHHKPHMFCPDANPGRRGRKPATNRLSYGAAKSLLWFSLSVMLLWIWIEVMELFNLLSALSWSATNLSRNNWIPSFCFVNRLSHYECKWKRLNSLIFFCKSLVALWI